MKFQAQEPSFFVRHHAMKTVACMVVTAAGFGQPAHAADISATVPAASGFSVKGSTGTERLRVEGDTGAVKFPALPGTSTQTNLVCHNAASGQLGPCAAGVGSGAQGPAGPQGLPGDQGPQGNTGSPGPAGIDGQGVPVGGTSGQVLTKIDGTNYNTQWSTPVSGGSTLIPFASGQAVNLAPLPLDSAAVIGFGSSVSGIQLLQSSPTQIDMSGQPNYAFSIPTNGNIAALSADFSTTAVTVPFLGLGSIKLIAQVFQSLAFSNLFNVVPGASCELSPAITSVVPFGAVFSCVTSGLNIPITGQTRLLMVIYAKSDSINNLPSQINGHASAGLKIQ